MTERTPRTSPEAPSVSELLMEALHELHSFEGWSVTLRDEDGAYQTVHPTSPDLATAILATEPGRELLRRATERISVEALVTAAPEPERDRLAALGEAYRDRNLVVQAFAWAMEQQGWPVAWGADESEPGWPVLYIETPQGQVSWHIPVAERIYEPPVRPEHGPVAWDGHTTEEKFARLAAALGDRS